MTNFLNNFWHDEQAQDIVESQFIASADWRGCALCTNNDGRKHHSDFQQD